MQITRVSMMSGKTHTMEIDVTQDQLDTYYSSGEVIQNVLPHLSADEREFIMTGITPQEWAEMFKEPEDGE